MKASSSDIIDGLVSRYPALAHCRSSVEAAFDLLVRTFRAGGNSFGMCMALAIARFPGKASEISSLMVMAIVGGGIVSAVLGFAQTEFGPVGIVAVLGVCLAYLFALGLFAAGRRDAKE